jgi:hypothetical protein
MRATSLKFGILLSRLNKPNNTSLLFHHSLPLLLSRMRISSILSPTFSLILAALALADAASDVIDLTPSNIKSVVDPEELILVEFFAPWYAFVPFLRFSA